MRNARSFPLAGLFTVLVVSAAPSCGDSAEVAGNASNATGGTAGVTSTGTGAHGGAGASAGTAGSGAGGLGLGIGGGGAGGATTTTGGAGGAATGGTGGAPVLMEVPCVNQVYECGDIFDNDGDGLVDWMDPDCLGPCDNTENSFYGGIPGQPGPACTVDCYWDANSGSGDDECNWSHQCDKNEETPPGHPEPASKCPYDPDANIPGTALSCDDLIMAQSETCASFCGPLTPNGCDCFGCCELPAGSGKYVWLGSEDEATGEGSCTMADIADPDKCEPCFPVPSCLNDCELCELCIGKDELPPECDPSGTGGAGGSMQCPPGIQACGVPGQAPCPAGHYCITGCCQMIREPQ